MIKLIVLDVDGTLTNGKIIYDNNGLESKQFDVKDGLAIASWTKRLNMSCAIITGRQSQIVTTRAKELGIQYLYQNIDNKQDKIENILDKLDIRWDNVACIGDDLNDYGMLKKAKLSFCPNDAIDDIKNIVNIVCSNDGGSGAVRQMIEYILKYNDNELGIKNLWV